MFTHISPIRFRSWLAAGLVAIAWSGASAADLPSYRPYAYEAPSPCQAYERTILSALHDIRGAARVFHAHHRAFLRVKRRRANDGFAGPDITVNMAMTSEQIEIATGASVVEKQIVWARRFHCLRQARLNAIDNEAERLREAVANDAIWIDPRTYR